MPLLGRHSPAESIFGRKIPNLLPGHFERTAAYLNDKPGKGRMEHTFQDGDKVWVKMGDRKWKEGKIVTKDRTPRSYYVDINGTVLRRNEMFIKKAIVS